MWFSVYQNPYPVKSTDIPFPTMSLRRDSPLLYGPCYGPFLWVKGDQTLQKPWNPVDWETRKHQISLKPGNGTRSSRVDLEKRPRLLPFSCEPHRSLQGEVVPVFRVTQMLPKYPRAPHERQRNSPALLSPCSSNPRPHVIQIPTYSPYQREPHSQLRRRLWASS